MALVKLNNRGVRSATTFGSISALGEMRFISKQTASADATIDFTSGIDSTYKEYLFTFNNIHPETDNKIFQFQADTGTNTSYNQTLTTTSFRTYQDEAGSETSLGYVTGSDQAQGTDFQYLAGGIGNGSDESGVGYLHLFNPASTVFVKHFISTMQFNEASDYTENRYNAGYFNTTTAITRVRFKMDSGNIDAGDICLYGIN